MQKIIEQIKQRVLKPVAAVVLVTAILFFLLGQLVGYRFARKKEEFEKKLENENSLALPFGSIVKGLKGVDLRGLDENEKLRVLKLLNVVNCLSSDGRMSLARCRRDVPHCVTSQRMADYIVQGVKKGLEDEVILARMYEKAVREDGAMAHIEDKKISLQYKGLPSTGRAGALVTVVVFYDYTSSFSRHALDEVAGMYNLYPDRVRVVFWPYPRSRLDVKAEKAARVALAAQKLGKFDVVHPLLLESEGEIGEGRLDRFTKAAGLEPDSLNQVAVSSEIRKRLNRLQNKASHLGIGYYPAIFVNGRRITGAIPSTCMLVGTVQETIVGAVVEEYDGLASRIAPQ